MKRALSPVIAVVLLTLVALSLGVMIWSFSTPLVEDLAIEAEVRQKFQSEQMEVGSVEFGGGTARFAVRRGASNLQDISLEQEVSQVTEQTRADVVLLGDRSFGMVQSGWNVENFAVPIDTFTITVPNGDYSPEEMFEVIGTPENLLIAMSWDQKGTLEGSEASELVLNIKRPDDTWLFSHPDPPNEAEGIVDPPQAIGEDNEYFSGISSKPQYIHIENPFEGMWSLAVHGWNFRPKGNESTDQEVQVEIYQGDQTEIMRNSEEIYLDLMKQEFKELVDDLQLQASEDRAAYAAFSETAELFHTFSEDPTSLKSAIDATSQQSGIKFDEGITFAHALLDNDARAGAEQILVLFTAGHSDTPNSAVIASANTAKNDGVTIFTVGLGPLADESLLQGVASRPDYYFYSPDSVSLPATMDSLSTKIREVTHGSSTSEKVVSEFLQVIFTQGNKKQTRFIESGVPKGNDVGVYEVELPNLTGVDSVEVYLGVEVNGDRITSDLLARWDN